LYKNPIKAETWLRNEPFGDSKAITGVSFQRIGGMAAKESYISLNWGGPGGWRGKVSVTRGHHTPVGRQRGKITISHNRKWAKRWGGEKALFLLTTSTARGKNKGDQD